MQKAEEKKSFFLENCNAQWRFAKNVTPSLKETSIITIAINLAANVNIALETSSTSHCANNIVRTESKDVWPNVKKENWLVRNAARYILR